ncbi:MAG: hypothetical protein AVDCRST_MAG77-426 [uncultured Chloroflexi bacterium]|uniref:Cache domain-containing protein n=1 Tax=uncultured Chloroflexota bacterium TaxID=166587 RepID=A0A6J4HCQ8_9CHLR|nr:MAG: hypothetical protein AVDCRST_MAG77-426 [uncultured Chloroflexota bacterium]
MRFWTGPLSLSARLALATIAVLFAVQVIGVLAYQRDLDERRRAELANAVALGRSIATVVDGFAQDLERTTFAAAVLLGRQAQPLDQASTGPPLKAILDDYPRLRALFLTDLAGRVTASDSGIGIGTDASARPYIGSLQRGAATVWSGSLSGLESGEVTIAFGRPVRGADGAPRAFMIAAFHAARMAEGLPIALPPDAEVAILDENGQVLHSSARPQLGPTERDVRAAPGVAAALAGAITPVSNAVTPFAGSARFGVFVPVERTRWVVGLTRPQAPLEAALRRRFIEQSGAIAAVMLGAAALQALLVRRLARPLEQLAAAARRCPWRAHRHSKRAGLRRRHRSRPPRHRDADHDRGGRRARDAPAQGNRDGAGHGRR